jgi:chemotaxis signal transduction protein
LGELGLKSIYATTPLGGEQYGIDILKVQEIRGYEAPTRIANAPSFILGVLNLRGVIVPIWDMRIKLRMDRADYDSHTVTIVLNVGERVIGLVVDAVQDVVALKAEAIVPGRGEAMKGNANVNKALDYTQRWVTTLFQAGKEAVAAKMDLKAAMAHTRKSMDPVFGHVFIYEHCLPFDVTRAYDEASGIKNPRIWTAERDMEMWKALQS